MPTIVVQVRRFSVVSSRPFEEIVRRLTATIGHPEMNAFHSAVASARNVADLEEIRLYPEILEIFQSLPAA